MSLPQGIPSHIHTPSHSALGGCSSKWKQRARKIWHGRSLGAPALHNSLALAKSRRRMAVLLALLFRLLDEPPDLFWLKGHLQMCDTKWRQGIDDSVCDRRTSANSPRFTTAFGAERIDRSRRDGTVGFQCGH